MSKPLESISVYWPFAVNQIKRRFSYLAGFFMRILGGLMFVFIQASLWDAIYRSSRTEYLRGYDRAGLLSYVIMSWFTFQLVNSGVEWNVAGEIRRGSIATNLIRPAKYIPRLLAEAGGNILVNLTTIVIPAWIALQAIIVFGMHAPLPTLERLCLYPVSLILGFAISFLINFLFSLLAFWVTYFWGMAVFKNAVMRLFTGELIPLAFFPVGAGLVFSYLPFAGMISTPVSIYLGTYSGATALRYIGIQACWVALLALFVRMAWKKAIVKLTVSGG